DKIRLTAGIFNFGDFESISINKDLTIEGAWDKLHKKPLTTVKGGFAPFSIGRLDPGFKPDTMVVNGHPVTHITSDVMGKFYFPNLYPPYFDQAAMNWTQKYAIEEHWVPVVVNIRQITFLRPYQFAIFTSAMRGGVIERCRFVGAWPIQADFWGGGFVSMGIMWWNIQGDLSWSANLFPQPEPVLASDYIRGDILVRDNVFESMPDEALEGSRDAGKHIVFVPFDGNSAPPGNDYANYVVQDIHKNPYMFLINSDETPMQYWVRKGYTAFWQTVDDIPQVVAFTGQDFGVHMFFTEMNLTLKNNTFHNQHISICDASSNGQYGTPLNLIVDSNRFISNLH
ncbi:MAG: hypothetical protein IH586_01530, partial [Anaerolineaceae bacterium]|nr:hypothetical protein [Anaerolineaceae bacterium]